MPDHFTMPEILLQEEPEPQAPGKKPRSRLRRVSIISACVGVVIGLVIVWLMIREPMTELTEASLSAAREKWTAANITDYDMILENQPPGRAEAMRFTVQVRHGRVANVLSGGEPADTHEPELYAVDGLFEMLERELDLARSPDSPFKATGGGKVFQRVRFHDELGYPERYLRVVGGSNQNSAFTVVSFTAPEQ
jgi:hypothetical protein